MRALLGAACGALALMASGCVLGGDDDSGEDPPPPPRTATLSEAQLVGQRIVTGFEGTRPPQALREWIRRGQVAGVILFEDNFHSVAEARKLVRQLQGIARPAELPEPMLIAIDQEGGSVERIEGPPDRSAAEMGLAGDSACAEEGASTGEFLAEIGVNVDLAPVLDVARSGSAIATEGRAFGDDPALVARCGEAFAAGLERHGVVPTAKHFPGIGAAAINTDDALQRIELAALELRDVDIAPFASFVAGGAAGRLVMMSSAVYPAFSEEPAAMTRKLATGELRERLGFEGASITDALETASTQAFGGPTEAAVQATRAGTDLLLFVSLDAARAAVDPLRRVLRSEPEEFAAAVERVLAIRSGLP